jgi:hypothetical protein
MTKLLIFGNSHVIAIKDGWALASEAVAHLQPAYFTAPGEMLLATRVENSRLIPIDIRTASMTKRTCGEDVTDLSEPDNFLIVGLGLRFAAVAALYTHHRIPAHASEDQHLLLSPSALKATIRGYVESTAAVHVARCIRTVTANPVFVMPEPLHSDGAIDREKERELWNNPHLIFLHELYVDAITAVMKCCNVNPVFQPPHTIGTPPFTKRKYAENARQMWEGKKDPHTDGRHMNAEFGAEMLKSIFKPS